MDNGYGNVEPYVFCTVKKLEKLLEGLFTDSSHLGFNRLRKPTYDIYEDTKAVAIHGMVYLTSSGEFFNLLDIENTKEPKCVSDYFYGYGLEKAEVFHCKGFHFKNLEGFPSICQSAVFEDCTFDSFEGFSRYIHKITLHNCTVKSFKGFYIPSKKQAYFSHCKIEDMESLSNDYVGMLAFEHCEMGTVKRPFELQLMKMIRNRIKYLETLITEHIMVLESLEVEVIEEIKDLIYDRDINVSNFLLKHIEVTLYEGFLSFKHCKGVCVSKLTERILTKEIEAYRRMDFITDDIWHLFMQSVKAFKLKMYTNDKNKQLQVRDNGLCANKIGMFSVFV